MTRLEELFNPKELREDYERKTEICAQCKKVKISAMQTRCNSCRENKCLHCGSSLTKYRRALENGNHGTAIFVCEDLRCWASFNMSKVETWVA
jgi:hypothetical protein